MRRRLDPIQTSQKILPFYRNLLAGLSLTLLLGILLWWYLPTNETVTIPTPIALPQKTINPDMHLHYDQAFADLFKLFNQLKANHETYLRSLNIENSTVSVSAVTQSYQTFLSWQRLIDFPSQQLLMKNIVHNKIALQFKIIFRTPVYPLSMLTSQRNNIIYLVDIHKAIIASNLSFNTLQWINNIKINEDIFAHFNLQGSDNELAVFQFMQQLASNHHVIIQKLELNKNHDEVIFMIDFLMQGIRKNSRHASLPTSHFSLFSPIIARSPILYETV